MNKKKRIALYIIAGLILAAAVFLSFWYDSPVELPQDNHLLNPWFENKEPVGWEYPEWSKVWKGFDICPWRPHTGWRSACLYLMEDPQMPTAIWGVKQELKPKTFPRYISGWFRANKWEQGTLKMYLQVVVISWFPKPRAGMNNFQVRFLLGGVTHQPYRMKNVRYIIVQKEPPPMGQWVPFTLDVGEAFRSQWGYVPDEWDKVDVFFEARYDEMEKEHGPVEAKVFYDDLYVGDTRINRPRAEKQIYWGPDK